MHEGELFLHILGQGQGHEGPKLVEHGPTPDRQSAAMSAGANGAFDILNKLDTLLSVTYHQNVIYSGMD